MRRRRSIVLLSGGLDSAANLAFCREFDEPVLALTVDYGQRAAPAEIRASRALCETFDIPHEMIECKSLGKIGGSALTELQNSPIPKLSMEDLNNPAVTQETARKVWVPNRNGVLINLAAAWAERQLAERVVVGFNSEEAATFPDNSVEYLNRATAALAFSTANGVQVFSYTSNWDKSQIVSELKKMATPFPFEQVWSCYHGGVTQCGTCESCLRFSRAIGTLTGNLK